MRINALTTVILYTLIYLGKSTISLRFFHFLEQPEQIQLYLLISFNNRITHLFFLLLRSSWLHGFLVGVFYKSHLFVYRMH